MKKLVLPFLCSLFSLNTFSQTVQPANVYPSNLEENMYFDKYDDKNKKISGVNFIILADGDDSKKVTPAFKVKIYLMPEGKTSEKDITIVKTYDLPGLYQMGSKEYKDEVIELDAVSVPAGKYRLGIWVNADKSFVEDASDNATLFKGVISFTPATPSYNDTDSPKEENSEDGNGAEGKGEYKEDANEMSMSNKTKKEQAQTNVNNLHELNKAVEQSTKQEVKKEATSNANASKEKKEIHTNTSNNQVKKETKAIPQKVAVKGKTPASTTKTAKKK